MLVVSYCLKLPSPFFFSSRRRHTRFKCDWSSDVCSSDLFETPADLRFLRSIGADAVGMSTVPEVTVARHGGMRVLGISGISNKANLDGDTLTTHEEVLEAGQVIVPKLSALIRGILRSL